MPASKPMTALYLPWFFHSRKAMERNNATIRSVPHIPPIFDTVFLCVLAAWQEWPDAWNDKWLRRCIDALQRRRLKVSAWQQLWITSDKTAKRATGWEASKFDPVNREYYIRATERIAATTAALGLPSCGLDCEPYGPNDYNRAVPRSTHRLVVKPGLGRRAGRLDHDTLKRITNAVPVAMVDYATPCWSSQLAGYAQAFQQLGKHPCDQTTYKERYPITRKADFVIGQYVTGNGRGGTFTPAECAAFKTDRDRFAYIPWTTYPKDIRDKGWHPKPNRRVSYRRKAARRNT